MAFDAFFLSAVLQEAREKILDARVDKIHQPSRDTVIIQLKCREGREKLLFALNPTAPRLHLTAASPENSVAAIRISSRKLKSRGLDPAEG